MPIKKGFDCYACDRPGRAHESGEAPEEYLQPGESASGEWLDTTYVDEHGAEQSLTLCPECARKFADLKRKQGAELARFARGW